MANEEENALMLQMSQFFVSNATMTAWGELLS